MPDAAHEDHRAPAGLSALEVVLRAGDDLPTSAAARLQLVAAAASLRPWAPAPGLVRRAEALELLHSRWTTAEIAERLHLSPNTLGSRIKALHGRPDAGRRSEVVDKAVIAGLPPPPEQ